MKTCTLILSIACIFSSYLPAQNSYQSSDTLSIIVDTTYTDFNAELYNRASYFLFREQLDSAEYYINSLIDDLSRKNELESSLGLKARLIQINILELIHERGDAIDEILQLEKDCISNEDWITLARVYLTAALAYEYNNGLSLCKKYLDKCNNLIEKHGLVSVYPRYCFRKHSYYRQLGLKDGLISSNDSVTYYIKETLTSSKKLYENHQGHYPQRQYEDFSEIYAEALKYYALTFFKEQDPRRIQYLIESKKVWERVQNDYHLGMTCRSLAQGYQKIGALNTALIYNDSSIYYLNNGYPIDSTLYNFSSSLTYGSRASILKDMNELDSAYYYLDLSHDFSLKFESFTFDEKFRAAEAKNYDLILEEQESKMFQTKKWNKTLLVLLSCISILICTIIFFYLKLQKANNLNKNNADKLLHLDQLKTNFFANISHELKTPISLIHGPLSYLLEYPKNWNNEELNKQLKIMQRNSQNLMNLVEEILDLSKIDQGAMELKEVSVGICNFLETICQTFESQLQSKQIEFILEWDEIDRDLFIQVDHSKLEKVVNNYLSNAIKYTPVGGTITLRLSSLDDELVIHVSDSGKGIHPMDLPYIFDRYYQSRYNLEQLEGGTGIGLSLVKEFADLMKGKAWAESELGVGSTFNFSFPKQVVLEHLEEVHYPIADPDNQLMSLGKDFTILVVEDTLDMRMFLRDLLSQHFSTIYCARNGAEGLEMLKKHGNSINLIVSDVMMPEVDGLSMLKEIKQHPEWFGIPVIMLTALSEETDRLKALTIGVDDYLTKPFSAAELLIRIQNLLYNYSQKQLWIESLDSQEVEELKLENNLLQKDKEWIDQLYQIIAEAAEDGIDVDKLASIMCLSPRQLTRRTKAFIGITPAKLIKEIKLDMARKLLESGEPYSIAEIAYKTGFETHANFSVVFKKRFGKSPSEYSRFGMRSGVSGLAAKL